MNGDHVFRPTVEEVHHIHQDRRSWKLDKTVRLGDLLVMLLLVFGAFGSYYHMSARVSKLEEQRINDAEIFQRTAVTLQTQSAAIATLSQIQDLYGQVRREYPPHRHVEGLVLYPLGQRPDSLEGKQDSEKRLPKR